MVIENELPRLSFSWFLWGFLFWFVVVAVLAVVSIGVAFLFGIISRGPEAGRRTVWQRIREGSRDLLATSPRRVYALSVLAVRQAVRRKVFVAFVLYLLVLMFAAWFFDPTANEPTQFYVNFLLSATTYLILGITLFLSVFSLPGEISDHTIYTVVTKPVRPTEIVLGRIFGFVAICSVMLLVMGIISYVFVTRSLSHDHEIVGANLRRIGSGQFQVATAFEGTTTNTHSHVHDFKIEIDNAKQVGGGTTDPVNDHVHRIEEEVTSLSGKITAFAAYEADRERIELRKKLAAQEKAERERLLKEAAARAEKEAASKAKEAANKKSEKAGGADPKEGDTSRTKATEDKAKGKEEAKAKDTAESSQAKTTAEGGEKTKSAQDESPKKSQGDGKSDAKESNNESAGESSRDAAAPRILITSDGSHKLDEGDLVRIHGQSRTRGKISDVFVVAIADDRRFLLQGSNATTLGSDYELRDWTKIVYRVKKPDNVMMARVPVTATRLQFRDRDGVIRDIGGSTNVGQEWQYRQHVEGGTKQAGIFHYEGIRRSHFPDSIDRDGIKLELKLAVFRTRKGNIEQKIAGQLRIQNPDEDAKTPPSPWQTFTSNEFQTVSHTLREITVADFFDKYVSADGELQVEVRCGGGSGNNEFASQYLGMAKYDVYFVAAQASPAFNFFKGHLGIWLQMVLVTSVGVVFSTFLNGFVAMLATAATLLGSFSLDFIRQLLQPGSYGGLAFESFYRILSRAPQTTELDPNATTTPVITFLDSGVMGFLWVVQAILPDMAQLSSIDYVSQGYSIPWNNLIIQFLIVLGFLIPLCLFGHYVLKGREIAR